MNLLAEFKQMTQKINFKDKLHKFTNYFSNIFFPRDVKCIFCGDELSNREYNSTCEICYPILPFIKKSCPKCGGAVTEENSGVCVDCKINNYDFTMAMSVFEYVDQPLNIIHKFKYNRKKYLAKPLGAYLAQRLVTENLNIDYITSVPIHTSKLKQRKFNQAELLSIEVSSLLSIPYLPLCIKKINTPSQTNLSFKDRRANVKDSFEFNKEYKSTIKNKNILIIDDVFTTGATCNEVSTTLLKAGANKCYVLTLAHVKVEPISSN